MKRLWCVLLALVLLIPVLPAGAEGVSEVMEVVNCNEYVSLRSEPDKSSARLKKVHLGELVTDCVDAGNGFVECDWDGVTGYILAEYLAVTDLDEYDQIMVNQMVKGCEEFVSLRLEPDTASERLIKVPLGAIVTGCVNNRMGFVYCHYKGKSGYILEKYLTRADYSVKATPIPTELPVQETTPEAEESAELPSVMTVQNCVKLTVLREKPSPSSKALAYVPLGALVDDCRIVTQDYVSCRYGNQYGYIKRDVLAEIETDDMGLKRLPDLPEYSALVRSGKEVLSWFGDGLHIHARRGYDGETYTESLLAVCYDMNDEPLWSVRMEGGDATEPDLTQTFIAGTEEEPLLVIAVCEKGLFAYGIGTEKVLRWSCTDDEVGISCAGLVYRVADGGYLYLTGAYTDQLVCVSPEGEVLWSAGVDDPEIYWPYRIDVYEERIEVLYDSCHEYEEKCYRAVFDKSGRLKNTEMIDKPDTE